MIVSKSSLAFICILVVIGTCLPPAARASEQRAEGAPAPGLLQIRGKAVDAGRMPAPIEVTLAKDQEHINNAVFSEDGRYLATTDGQNATLWDAASGRQIYTFPQPPNREIGEGDGWYSLAFLPVSSGGIETGGELVRTIPSQSNTQIAVAVHRLSGFPSLVAGLHDTNHFSALAVSPINGRIYTRRCGFNDPAKVYGCNGWDALDSMTGRTVTTAMCKGQVIAFAPSRGYALCAESYGKEGSASAARRDNTLGLYDIETGHLLRKLIGHEQPVTSAGYSVDGRMVFSSSHDGSVRLWDSDSGTLIKTIKAMQPKTFQYDPSISREPSITGVNHAIISPDGAYVVAAYPQGAALIATSTGSKIKDLIADAPFGPYQFFPDGKRLLSGHTILETGTGRPLYRLQDVPRIATPDGVPVVTKPLGFLPKDDKILFQIGGRTFQFDMLSADFRRLVPEEASSQFLSGAGTHLFHVRTDRVSRNALANLGITVYSAETAQKIAELQTTPSGTSDGAGSRIDSVSDDGAKAVMISKKGAIDLLLVESKQQQSIGTVGRFRTWREVQGKWVPSDGIDCEGVNACASALSTDANRLLALAGEARVFSVPDRARLGLVKTDDEWGECGVQSRPLFSPDGRRFALSFLGCDYETIPTVASLISVYSVSPLRKLYSVTPSVERWFSGDDALKWSSDSKTLLLAGGGTLVHLNADTGQVRKAMRVAGEHDGAAPVFSHDARWFANLHGIWEAETGGQRLALALLGDGDEWVAMTPEGYYSSSDRGHDFVILRRGSQIYRADQLYDVFYRPDLVVRKLRGEDIRGEGKLLTIDEALANPPPVAEIVGIAAKGEAGAQEVSYRVQGKGGGIGEVRVFHNRKLIQRVSANLAGDGPYEGRATVQGAPGENEVTVMGMNRQNSVQGMMRSRGFTVADDGRRPQAWVLAVGIGKYRSDRDTLTFAVSDAQRLAAALGKGLGSLYRPEDIHVEVLADEQATRQGILAQFQRLQAVVRPGDQFVLFFASHGLLSEGKYYVVTHDYDGRFDSSRGLSSDELMEASRQIGALHQLLIFDTCHAGGMDPTVTAVYDARLSVLARQMGLHVFAAASTLQQAVEGFEGSGVFTHALLEGLRAGGKVDGNQDGLVSVAELGAYAKPRTEALAQRLGYHQTPRIIAVGQDRGLYRFATVPPVAAAAPASRTPPDRQPEPAVRTTVPPIEPPQRIVTGAGLALRSDPNRRATKRLLLRFGTVATLLEEDNQGGETWSRVAAEGGEGWLPAAYLTEYSHAQGQPIRLAIARRKLAESGQFGDLVEVGHFLFSLDAGGDGTGQTAELAELTQEALRKTYSAIPAAKRGEAPYRDWLQEQSGRPGWGEIVGH